MIILKNEKKKNSFTFTEEFITEIKITSRIDFISHSGVRTARRTNGKQTQETIITIDLLGSIHAQHGLVAERE